MYIVSSLLACNNLIGCARGFCACSPATMSVSVSTGQGTCQQDQFTCSNGECISQSLYCNDAVNCSDGSDEVNCRSEFV